MNATTNQSQKITLKEARALTKRGKTTIRNWIASGKLACRKIDGISMVDKEELLALHHNTPVILPKKLKGPSRASNVGRDHEAKHTMATDRLRPHPLNSEIYGCQHDPRLLESIKDKGVLSPLLVTADGLVISGGERLWAAQQSCLAEVPVRVMPSADEMEIKLRVLEANIARDKTNEQRIREYQVYKGIEAAKAQVRQKAGNLVSNLTQGSGKARDLAAEKVGWCGTTAEKGSQVLAAIEAHSTTDTKEIVDVRLALETSIDSAYKKATALGWLGAPPHRNKETGAVVKTYQRVKTTASKLAESVTEIEHFTPVQIRELRDVLEPLLKLIGVKQSEVAQ